MTLPVKLRAAAFAALLPAALLVSPAFADETYSGSTSGKDPFGGNYATGLSFGVFPIWEEDPNTNGGGDPTYTGSQPVVGYIFSYTGTDGNRLMEGDFGYGFAQIGNPEGQQWDVTFLSPTSIEFTVPKGVVDPAGPAIFPGDQYSVFAEFKNPINPDAFSFTGTWIAAAPEPGVWAMLVAGFAMMGAVVRLSSRSKTLAA